MNYYPFHIGDYASATRHLSWDEDAAYRRLLDVYYTLEKPIPEEKVLRLAMAVTKMQREAVNTVLQEFFTLTAQGWTSERCEQELDAMRIKQAAQEEKDRHETDRMRRHRERRSSMFDALRLVGIVPAWDVPMKELQRLSDTYSNAPATLPETHLQREQVISGDEPATAIPTPTPTPTPVLKEKKSASAPTIPEIPESLMADFQKIRRSKKAPLTDTAINGLRREAEKAGVTMTEAITACCEFGWQGFNADWYAERTASKTATTGSPPTESFSERDARAKREAWEVMTNRKWPEQDLPQSARSSAIDAAAFELPNNIRRLAQ